MEINSSGSAILHRQLEINSPQKKFLCVINLDATVIMSGWSVEKAMLWCFPLEPPFEINPGILCSGIDNE